MKGKITPESNNLFQDQAKILFNYYVQMAEKIVHEEEHIEKEIAKLKEELSILDTDLLKTRRLKWFLCILIFTFIYFTVKENGLKKKIISLDERIDVFKKQHKEIFRDYRVSKLGIAYVPVASQIKYENKSFIVDHTGMVGESEVKLQLSKQNDLLIKTISELEKLSDEAPIVEGSEEIEEIETQQYSRSMQHLNQHDYFGRLERSLRTISYCMDDLDVISVELPLVENNSSYLNFIKEFATTEVPKESPVFEVFDINNYSTQISKFQELNKLKDSLSRDTAQFEDVLRGLMITMANSVQAISALKVASTDKIIFESNKLLYKILKSPYNHYSPVLEASEIERIRNEDFNYGESASEYVPFQLKESSKVKFNLISGMWTGEDGSSTNFPFGVHQIHEEIVAPIVQNLMNETRIERLKIYNHIKDQKISYLNKWHQDTEDFYGRNRSESADLINLMRASLRDYVAAYNTLTSLKKTEDSMAESGGSLDSTVVSATQNSAEVFAAFELQSREFQNVQLDFENFMERLKEDIDLKAEKFEHIDYYDALLRDGNSKDTAVAASEANNLESRRKPLIGVNPLFAKISDLPPIPNVEEITYEHLSLNLPVIAKNSLTDLDGDQDAQGNNMGQDLPAGSPENIDENDIKANGEISDPENIENPDVKPNPESEEQVMDAENPDYDKKDEAAIKEPDLEIEEPEIGEDTIQKDNYEEVSDKESEPDDEVPEIKAKTEMDKDDQNEADEGNRSDSDRDSSVNNEEETDISDDDL